MWGWTNLTTRTECSPGAILPPSNHQPSLLLHLFWVLCNPCWQYYDVCSHLDGNTIPYAYLLLSQPTFHHGLLRRSKFVPKVAINYLSGNNTISFINCGIQLLPFLDHCWSRVPSPGSDGLWTLCGYMPASPLLCSHVTYILCLQGSWYLSRLYSEPWLMTYIFWISLTVHPKKPIISFVRFQLSWNLFVLIYLFMRIGFMSVVFSSFLFQ